MSDLQSKIDDALAGCGIIPRDTVVQWIRDAQDDLRILSKLYQLTDTGYYRIQPELGADEGCFVIQHYLLECIRQNVTDSESIQSRWDAARTLHAWFCHLGEMDQSASVLARAAQAITDLFLAGDESIRDALENGFLEHALEMDYLRQYFAQWSEDSRLSPAWVRAMKWGKDHPNYTWGLLQQLRKLSEQS